MIGPQELADARADAEREMRSRASLSRLTGTSMDPDTLVEGPTWTATYTDVPATIVVTGVGREQFEQGGAPSEGDDLIVRVPARVVDVKAGDRVVCSDPDDLAASLTVYVRSWHFGSTSAARTLTCSRRGQGLIPPEPDVSYGQES